MKLKKITGSKSVIKYHVGIIIKMKMYGQNKDLNTILVKIKKKK